MKVLMVTHSYNFGPQLKGSNGLTAYFMEKEIKRAGMTYEYCRFTNSNLRKAIENGINYIIIFTEENIPNASMFLGDSNPGVITRMYTELYDIEKRVPIYPPVASMELTFSKKYVTVLPNKTKLFMPHTKYFMYYKTKVEHDLSNAYAYFQKKKISTIVIKLGYSGDMNNVYVYTIESLQDNLVKYELLEKLAYHRTMVGKTFLIFLQPFNPIVADRLNEYRLLFINGQPSPIAAFGFRTDHENNRIYIPSIEMDPTNNKEHYNIIKLAKCGHHIFNKYVGTNLVVVRMDITWMVLEDGTKHYYVNEIENLCGTFYFGIQYQPKKAAKDNRITDQYECNKNICSTYPDWVQHNMARSFVKYIIDHTNTK